MTEDQWKAIAGLLRDMATVLDPPPPVNTGDDDPWESLSLDVRSYNALDRWIHGQGFPRLTVKTVGDLRRLRDADLLQIKNFGTTCLRAVRLALAEHRGRKD